LHDPPGGALSIENLADRRDTAIEDRRVYSDSNYPGVVAPVHVEAIQTRVDVC
jgi:hypothetical protein